MKLNPSDIPEVSIPFMQETHLEEVTMLNELYALFEQDTSSPEIGEKIEALALHTHAHFAREEEKMLELNFPAYPMHKHAHDEYLNEFDALLAGWRSSGDLAPVSLFLQHTTPAWLKQHISTMDFVTANFFAMSESH